MSCGSLWFSPSSDMRERGAWVCAVGSSCASLRWLMRVFTRPVSIVLSRRGYVGVVATHQANEPPGALAPSRVPVPRAGRTSESPSWPLRFHSPEAMPCPFVSPRNKEGSAGLTAGPSPRSGACSTGRGRLLPVPKRPRPRRPTPRHPEFGRLEISLRQGEKQSTGEISPKRKMRFLFWLVLAQRLGCALNLSFRRWKKSVGLGR
jgi:hypothetical protein